MMRTSCLFTLAVASLLAFAGSLTSGSAEMDAGHRMLECWGKGDVDCMEDMASRECHGHVEAMPGVLPYKRELHGKSCVSDHWKEFDKVWKFKEPADVKWFQGEEGQVVCTMFLHLQWRDGAEAASGGAAGVSSGDAWDVARPYTSLEMAFDKDMKLTEWHTVHDSAFDEMMMRHKRDKAAERFVKAMLENDEDAMQDLTSDKCEGREEGPEKMLPWCGKYSGKTSVSDFMKKYGEYFEIKAVKDVHLSYPKHADDGLYVMSATLVRRAIEAPEAASAVTRALPGLFGRDAPAELEGAVNSRFEFDEAGMLVRWDCAHDSLAEYVAMRAAGRMAEPEDDIKSFAN